MLLSILELKVPIHVGSFLVVTFLVPSEVLWQLGKYFDVCNKQIKKQTVKVPSFLREKD
jgi:hypothetical protein